MLCWVKVCAEDRTSILTEQSILKTVVKLEILQSPNLEHKGSGLMFHTFPSLYCFIGRPEREVENPAVCIEELHPNSWAHL